MSQQRAKGLPRLYWKTRTSFHEEHSVPLPLNSLGQCERLVYIPWTTRDLRFDPMESVGAFIIEKFTFKYLLPITAVKSLIKHLQRHPNYRRKTTVQIKGLLKSEAKQKAIRWQTLALQQYSELFTPAYAATPYTYWITEIEQPRLQTAKIAKRVSQLKKGPMLSVILPTYKTALHHLRACIDSVLQQSYTHWELCIADDASAQPELTQTLQAYAAQYPQIKLVLRNENGHISAASNSALALATGEFVALLDHDDLLAPHALLSVAEKIADNPNVRLLYSDEDKIDINGERHSPDFKPDWNPELLRGQNYLCHLCVYERSLLDQLGGFRTGVEGAQDWDLALRATEQLDASQIEHIPEILYHWRAIPGSTALATKEKDYISAARQRVLQGHIRRVGLNACILPTKDNHWRIRHQLPSDPPLVSLLIPTHNGLEILKPCLEGILQKTDYPNYEIILIDNNSDDPHTLHFLQSAASLARVKVIQDSGPFNYSAINNRATAAAQGSLLAFVNNDIEPINSDWLTEMVAEALQAQTGAVGAMLYYPNDRVQHAGVVLGIAGPRIVEGVAGHAFKRFPRGHGGQMNRLRLRQNYSAVTAACLVVRREVFEAVGGFNETDLPVSFNDVDLCLRIRAAGYRNLWTPFAELYHLESASRGAEDTPAKQARAHQEFQYMRQTWGPLLDNDPAYNPNLTLIHEDFSIDW
jgi:GT2 family glycosyltransferase